LAESINQARRVHDFQLWAYVFMPDHVHLVVFPIRSDTNIGTILKAIKAPVARQAIRYLREHAPEWLPRISRRRGTTEEHLFWQSGGGYDRNITSPKALFSMIDYIHANPVRSGLVDRPTDWKWSSAADHVGFGEIFLKVDSVPREWLE